MNLDPQKFFIGLMDFFSILLPGALLTWLLMDKVGPTLVAGRYAALDGTAGWAAFLMASYLLGHLIFLLGSWLDELYDGARRHTLDAQVARLARRGKLLPWPARTLIWLVFRRERNLAVDRAARIKRKVLAPLMAGDAINAFQWSKALLGAESPASLALVQRFEADSKFFRCLTVVLLILLAAWPWHALWPATVIPVLLVLLPLALWRYMEQRYKATNQAYWAVIMLFAKDGKVVLDDLPGKAADPDHAGGVVYRRRGRTAEYLLVEASDDPSHWVLPKGHLEPREHHSETAVREVHEETGVWAGIVDDLGVASWTVDGSVVATRFFLMRSRGRGLRQDKDRRHVWLPLRQAIARASRNETRELLQLAEQRRSHPRSPHPIL